MKFSEIKTSRDPKVDRRDGWESCGLVGGERVWVRWEGRSDLCLVPDAQRMADCLHVLPWGLEWVGDRPDESAKVYFRTRPSTGGQE